MTREREERSHEAPGPEDGDVRIGQRSAFALCSSDRKITSAAGCTMAGSSRQKAGQTGYLDAMIGASRERPAPRTKSLMVSLSDVDTEC